MPNDQPYTYVRARSDTAGGDFETQQDRAALAAWEHGYEWHPPAGTDDQTSGGEAAEE